MMLTHDTAIVLINMLTARIQEMEILIESTEAELVRAEEKAALFERKIREAEEKIKNREETKK